MLDLTKLQTPTIEYAVMGKDGKPIEICLDLDRITLDMSISVPTLFKPTGEIDDGGNPVLGLNKLLAHVTSGQSLPASVPNWEMTELAIRRAMRIPEHCGLQVVMTLFTAFLQAVADRAEQKKAMPVSPDSPAATPA